MDKPFQTYDDTSDPATCAPRLAALRAELARRGLDGFVVPHMPTSIWANICPPMPSGWPG